MEAESSTQEDRGVSAAQRRAEIRRRKLLMNSEQRMNRIVGFNNGDNDEAQRVTEPRFHLDLEKADCFSPPVSTKRVSPFVSEARCEGSVLDERREEVEETERGVRLRPRGETSNEERSRSPRRGLNTYLSRFDDAVKLRAQLTNEKASQESGLDADEFDPFRLFRLVGSVVLAVCVRIFACHYLSIFAPFLTLELAYMGLYKYFPKVDRKMKTTMLSAALLLSGIPAEVISRSAETYRTMGDVFSDLCIYFFTFITCHEIVTAFSSQST